MVRRSPRKPDQGRPRPGKPILERRWPWALLGLFAVALAWRGLYLGRLAGTPLFGTLRGDERIYWDWSSFLIAHGLRGTNAFFMGPLYPYLLAIVRIGVGSDVLRVLWVQAVGGALACVLLADAARRWVRPAVALGLGLVLSLYEMAVLFDGLLLMESLLFLLEAFLIWLWCRAAARGAGPWLAAAMGLVVGLIAECRATGALLLLPCALLAWAAGSAAAGRGIRAARLALMTALFLVATVPAAVWNGSTAHEFIPFTYNLGFNLFMGNNPHADGTFGWVPGMTRLGSPAAGEVDGGAEGDGREYLAKTRGLILSPVGSSDYWAREALAFARARPGAVVWLAGRKLALMLNRTETPQIENVELFRRYAGPLGLPIVGSFLVVGWLGLVGSVVSGRWGLPATLLRLYLLVLLLGTLPFFVTDRYRFHLVPALAVLAAMAVEVALECVRRRRFAAGLGWASALALGIVLLPMRPTPPGVDQWFVSQDLGLRWLEQGKPDEALREFERAIQIDRDLRSTVEDDTTLRERRAQLYFNYGVALRKTGQEDAALPWLAAAATANPSNAHYLRTLGDAYLVHGRTREGDSLLARVRSLVGGEGEASLSDGYRMAREGRLDEAERLFRKATQQDTRLYGAWGALIRVQVQRGAIDRARATLEQAAGAATPRHVLKVYEALIAAAGGDSVAARAALDAVPPEAIANDPTLSRVVAWTMSLLRPR